MLAAHRWPASPIEIEAGFPISMADIPEPTLELAPGTEVGWYRSRSASTSTANASIWRPHCQTDQGAERRTMGGGAAHRRTCAALGAGTGSRTGRAGGAPGGERIAILKTGVRLVPRRRRGEQISELQAALRPICRTFTVRYFGRDHPRWLAMRDRCARGAELAPPPPRRSFIRDPAPVPEPRSVGLSHLYDARAWAAC